MFLVIVTVMLIHTLSIIRVKTKKSMTLLLNHDTWLECLCRCLNLSLVFFFRIQLAADPDINVKNGSELLDRLMKVSGQQC